jgi:hypothetical protein
MIDSITIGGTAVALSTVAYDLTIQHGRSSITDGPAASQATLTLLTTTTMPAVALGNAVVVTAYGATRFTGTVTDLAISHLVDGTARVTVHAVGPVAKLGFRELTPSSWPSETSAARASRILTAIGATATTTGSLTVTAKTASTSTALSLLQKLAEDTGAAIYDDFTGKVVFQDLEGREQSYIQDSWASMTGTWADHPEPWSQVESPAVAEPVPIPSDAIVWEPQFQQRLSDVINAVTVTYGSSSTTTSSDASSQSTYGVRAASLDTELADATSAQTRADAVIARLAQPRWQVGQVEVLVHELDAPTRALVLSLQCGRRCIVKGLPDPAPTEDWLGVVEGFTEHYIVRNVTENTSDQQHLLTLSLSDPFASYATVQWGQVTATRTWANILSTITWADVSADADLAP